MVEFWTFGTVPDAILIFVVNQLEVISLLELQFIAALCQKLPAPVIIP